MLTDFRYQPQPNPLSVHPQPNYFRNLIRSKPPDCASRRRT